MVCEINIIPTLNFALGWEMMTYFVQPICMCRAWKVLNLFVALVLWYGLKADWLIKIDTIGTYDCPSVKQSWRILENKSHDSIENYNIDWNKTAQVANILG